MKVAIIALSSLLAASLTTAPASAGGNSRNQSTIRTAQSTNCMLECRDKGWGEDQCKVHCKWKENN